MFVATRRGLTVREQLGGGSTARFILEIHMLSAVFDESPSQQCATGSETGRQWSCGPPCRMSTFQQHQADIATVPIRPRSTGS